MPEERKGRLSVCSLSFRPYLCTSSESLWLQKKQQKGAVPQETMGGSVADSSSKTTIGWYFFLYMKIINRSDTKLNRINHRVWLQRALLLSKSYLVLLYLIYLLFLPYSKKWFAKYLYVEYIAAVFQRTESAVSHSLFVALLLTDTVRRQHVQKRSFIHGRIPLLKSDSSWLLFQVFSVILRYKTIANERNLQTHSTSSSSSSLTHLETLFKL